MPDLNIADFANLSLGMSEDGELEFSNTPEDGTAAAGDEGQTDEKKTPATPEVTGATAGGDGTPVTPVAQSPAGDPPVDWEKRYKDLQADHTRKSQALSELQELKGQVALLKDLVAGKQTPSEDQTDEDLLEALADRERAPKVLQKLIADGVAKAMESTPEAKIQREFNETAAEIGQDFVTQLPIIKQLSSELAALNQNFSFKQLYALSKLVPAKAETATQAKPEATVSKPQASDGLTQGQADALKAKAASLTTESGVAANPDSKPKINSVKSALNAALEELGYA